MTDQNQPASTAPDRVPRIDDPGEFIASIPAMLGFTPHRSLVVAVLSMQPDRRGGLLEAIIRCDLHDAQHVVDSVEQACTANGADAVLAVVIDDRRRPPTPVDLVLLALQDRLEESGIEVKGTWAVGRIATGQRWHSLRPPHRDGTLPDPTMTLVALNRVYAGRQLHPDRRAIEALLTPLPDLTADITRRLSDVDVGQGGDPQVRSRAGVQTVLRTVAALHSGTVPTPRSLADVAVAWHESTIRDATLALAGTIHADAAEQLATTLTRALTGADRAHAAAVLAFFAYHRGDGVLAAIAIDTALTADDNHTLAGLLRAALDCALPSGRMHTLAQHAREAMGADGIEIPPLSTGPGQQ
ncbi:DUF4192 domain-containing protein [Nocardia testacea]|uniref:DUF4192 domain-containing protein n=1 Tax=Nocardia testacea TaxID=248551 RepID=UPI003A8ACFBD